MKEYKDLNVFDKASLLQNMVVDPELVFLIEIDDYEFLPIEIIVDDENISIKAVNHTLKVHKKD